MASDMQKLELSLRSGLIFFFLANPETYKFMSKVLGKWVATNGCPSTEGVLLHTVVFVLIVFLFMKLGDRRKESMCMKGGCGCGC